jgi:hypothetical protein
MPTKRIKTAPTAKPTTIAEAEEAGRKAHEDTVNAPPEEATERQPEPRAKTLAVVKGSMPSLREQQRRLVEIFVWYLRQLPEWRDGKSWDSDEYHIVNALLLRFFRDRNPTWLLRQDTKKYHLEDLPEAEAEEYNSLMWNAACAPDPRVARRLDLLQLARDKKWVIEFTERYERDREKLGLNPDFMLPLKSATPLEKSAADTWGGIQPAHV